MSRGWLIGGLLGLLPALAAGQEAAPVDSRSLAQLRRAARCVAAGGDLSEADEARLDAANEAWVELVWWSQRARAAGLNLQAAQGLRLVRRQRALRSARAHPEALAALLVFAKRTGSRQRPPLAPLVEALGALPDRGTALLELALGEQELVTDTPPGAAPICRPFDTRFVKSLIGAAELLLEPDGASALLARCLRGYEAPALARWLVEAAPDPALAPIYLAWAGDPRPGVQELGRIGACLLSDPRFEPVLVEHLDQPQARAWLARHAPRTLLQRWGELAGAERQLGQLTLNASRSETPELALEFLGLLTAHLAEQLAGGQPRASVRRQLRLGRPWRELRQLDPGFCRAYGERVEALLLGLEPFRDVRAWPSEFFQLLVRVGGPRTLAAYLLRPEQVKRFFRLRQLLAGIDETDELLAALRVAAGHETDAGFERAARELLLDNVGLLPGRAGLEAFRAELSDARRLAFDGALWAFAPHKAQVAAPPDAAQEVATQSDETPEGKVRELLDQLDPDAEDPFDGEGRRALELTLLAVPPPNMKIALTDALAAGQAEGADEVGRRRARAATLLLLGWDGRSLNGGRLRGVAGKQRAKQQLSLPFRLEQVWDDLSLELRRLALRESLRRVENTSGKTGFGVTLAPPAPEHLRFFVERIAALEPTPEVVRLWGRLEHFDLEAEPAVLEALKSLETLPGPPALIAAMREVQLRRTIQARQREDLVGGRFGPGPPPHLLVALDSPRAEQVLEAIEALVECQALGSVPELVGLARHPDEAVREAARQAVRSLLSKGSSSKPR